MIHLRVLIRVRIIPLAYCMKTLMAARRRRAGSGVSSPWALALFLAFTSFSLLPPAQAADPGDPAAGRRLGEAWCSNCHVLDTSQRATVTGAPSFAFIAANRAISPMALRAFFQTPHDRMPDLHLSNTEMDDLIAYILSLRGN